MVASVAPLLLRVVVAIVGSLASPPPHEEKENFCCPLSSWFPLTFAESVESFSPCLTFPTGQMGPSVLFSWYLKVFGIQSTASVFLVGLLCAFLDLV